MKRTELIMGMPVTVEIIGAKDDSVLSETFNYFRQVDARFSPFKNDSELSRLNSGLNAEDYSAEMREVLELCAETKRLSGGYFDIEQDGRIDTSGLVKGWAINNAAELIKAHGYQNFYVEAGGDIQAEGSTRSGKPWQVGIRNPFDINQNVRVVKVSGRGVATSGNYIRGDHIYSPLNAGARPAVVSLTVIGPNIYEADRFATAAFAMGKSGISYINSLPGFAGYMIDEDGLATYTQGFEAYAV